MLDTARKHTSLLVTVTAIAVLAASQASAQEGATKPGDGAEQAGPAAGVNADTIDGRHAIGPTTDAKRRAGKLVATNAQGYLPNDIVLKARNADTLDGLDSPVFARSAALGSAAGAVNEADNPVHWRQLRGVPSGIADGTVAWAEVTGRPAKYPDADALDGLDSTAFARTSALGAYATTASLASDTGAVNESDNLVHWDQLKGVPDAIADGTDSITQVTITRVYSQAYDALAGQWTGYMLSCPAGSTVTGGGFTGHRYLTVTESSPPSDTGWLVWVYNTDTVSHPFRVYALCLSAAPSSALATATRQVAPIQVRRRG